MDGVGELSRERASENILLGSKREANTSEKVIMPGAVTLLPTTTVVYKQAIFNGGSEERRRDFRR
jgi:hypothetical protein